MIPLTKENLKEFIINYPTTFNSLTDEYWQQGYLEGLKEVLADLEATFLWESNETKNTLESYFDLYYR